MIRAISLSIVQIDYKWAKVWKMKNTSMKQKKLLIFGGNALACDIVRTAKEMGIYTIVTDWYPPSQSVAKLISDEAWDVSVTAYDELSSRIRKEGIDGILTGYSDSYMIPYQHLCVITGKPCYVTKPQLEWTMDKVLFKAKCREYGVPVVPEYELDSFDRTSIDRFHKVIIKPADNSGSRGICICDNAGDFEGMVEYALSFSEKKKLVLERYMDCDDVSFEYKLQDGRAVLSSICDRYIYKTPHDGSVTSCLVYPSKYTDIYLSDVDKKVRGMFEKEGLKNGLLFMQAFVEDGHFFFYEMGFRLSGGRHYIFTNNQNKDNGLEQLVRFAIYGKMSDNRLEETVNPKFKDLCCQLSVICRSERIAEIEGWEKIEQMEQVIDVNRIFNVGDVVGKQGTTASIFARIHLVVKRPDELRSIIDHIYGLLKVLNEKGENLVIRCV